MLCFAAPSATGEGKWGTDEDTFIKMVCGHSSRYLQSLNEYYAKKHGDTLVHAVHKEMGGLLEKGLKALREWGGGGKALGCKQREKERHGGGREGGRGFTGAC